MCTFVETTSIFARIFELKFITRCFFSCVNETLYIYKFDKILIQNPSFRQILKLLKILCYFLRFSTLINKRTSINYSLFL